MKIEGSIEEVIFRNPDNGYSVIVLDRGGVPLTCVGIFGNIIEGEYVELVGEMVNNEKYGRQFAVKSVKSSRPNTLEGIERYLSSGLIRGIGPVTAHSIVEKFKLDTLDIIEFAPNRLAEVRGVSPSKAQAISEAFNEIKNMQKAVMFLQEYDISTHMAVKIFNTYQDRTIDIVSFNPYKLIEDIDGVGFLTADKIAKSMGIASNSEFRIRAGILHILKDSSEKSGNTCLPIARLQEESKRLLDIDEYDMLYKSAIDSLIIDGSVKALQKGKIAVIMLSKFYFLEQSIAKNINLLLIGDNGIDNNIDEEIQTFQEINKITFHEDQLKAIKTAIKENVSIITGGPGTGKTTIVKCILYLLRKFTNKISLLAPTGRAAKRLSESCNWEASTIHRALEVNFKDEKSSLFFYNEKNKLPVKVVILDEVSMVDVQLMSSLLKALPKDCKLILVGDKDQLPSVGAGNVLHDLLKSEIVSSVCLTQIYRQDEKSLIVKNAHAINNGEMPDLSNRSNDFFFENQKDSDSVLQTVVELVTNRLPNYLNIDPTSIQVLAPMKTGVCGVNNLNRKLQELINPQSFSKREINLEVNCYREGDKVMQIVNNYDIEWQRNNGMYVEKGKGVFNGDVGYIEQISQAGEIKVRFDDDRVCVYPRSDIFELTVAYATTIHKSQGSEFDAVVIPLVAGSPQILTRNLLYTAVTRAKKMVVLVGTKYNVLRMVNNNYTAMRYSMLTELIIEQKKNTEFLFK